MSRTEIELLERIETLLTSVAYRSLRDEIAEINGDKKLRAIYKWTGERSVRDIAASTKVPRATISQIWQRWERSGLIVKRGQQFVKVVL